jgi:hypothetical protein
MLRDILGERATTELAEELNVLFEQLKVLGWREVRPWSEFFGAFKLPEMTSSHLQERVVTNFLHYRSNYAVICAVLLLLQVFLCPMLIVVVPLTIIICCYILLVHKRNIKIGDITINAAGKKTFCAIFCPFFFAITGILERLVWIVIYVVFTAGLHMVLRPRNMSAKANKVYEEMKLNGYSMDWFTGSGEPQTASLGSGSSAYGDRDDPENPVERQTDTFGAAAASFGFSSNLGGSTQIDMRKRGPPVSGGGGGAAAAAAGRGAGSAKND